MYARVASFEQSDMSRVDELLATVSARAAAGQDMPDALRVLMLTDRSAGRMLGITFFETEEAIREAETGSSAYTLCRKERFDRTAKGVFIHTCSCVAYGQTDITARF